MDERTESRKRFIVNVLYLGIIVMIAYVILNYAIGWLLPLLIGVTIARLLNPLIRSVTKKTRIPRKIVAFVFVIFVMAFIGSALALLGVTLFNAARGVVEGFPGYYENTILPVLHVAEEWVTENLSDFVGIEEGEGFNLVGTLTNAVTNLPAAFSTVFNAATRAPMFMLQFIFTILFTLFATVYYMDAHTFLLRQMTKKRRLFVSDIIISFKRSIVSFYGAYLKIMAITFVELLVGLSIIRGSFSILPAFAIALVDFLPVLGCGTVLVPWAIISLIVGNTTMGIGLFILYIIIFIIRQFIEPKIVGDQLGLNPLLALTSMFVGVQVIGVLGLIIMPIIVTIIADLQRHEKINLFK
jgi:sporulation integral membrane protein YtvI